MKINSKGHIEIGGADTVELAAKFGTPLYVFDEAHIRNMMRVYRDTLNSDYYGHGTVLYASKAFSCTAIYAIAKSENIGIDVVSGGEFYTALQAGFPAEKAFMHGNNKLNYELEYALDNKIGYVVVDSYDEADVLNDLAKQRNIIQKVLIRINPGVEAHTHAYIQTARTDSKFGFSVSDGTAEDIFNYVTKKTNLKLCGLHCHIGSQIFEKQSFALAADKMMVFMKHLKSAYNFKTEILNIGGGFGIWYNDEDPKLQLSDYAEYLKTLINAVKLKAKTYDLDLPYLVIEPGRSIVGEAGITLYTVGAIKEIPGVKKYVAVDGGMFENPRYALYQSKYTVMIANRAEEDCTQKYTIAGKCCESGDIIAVDAALPEVYRGDILAVLSTGAYNYSMASNYNRNFIPACILVNNGEAEYIVKPQTFKDLTRNDAVPERLK